MNRMKFRPVGQPSSTKIVEITLTQRVPKTRTAWAARKLPFRSEAIRMMAAKGFVPVNY